MDSADVTYEIVVKSGDEKMTDLVSIIVPVYNAERYIESTAYSVISQTYDNWELLLVDDCSSDNSIQVMRSLREKDSRIRLLIQWRNGRSCRGEEPWSYGEQRKVHCISGCR